ncbi:MAG TPA: amidohydrolase family protein [Candidatus Acidoferrales bacterium]|nr:amidohydrolase family protein [Candidatus Acidoferrales bacterium]
MLGDLPTAGICDCHVHVAGPIERYPQIASRSYIAELATLETLREIAEPLGVSRFAIVQPSFYGTDNSCLLEALDTLGGRGRGVAAVDADAASAGLLREYARRGVRGLRLNLYSAVGGYSPQHLDKVLEKTARILPDASWHVEIIAPLNRLTAAAATIARAEAKIVIDHYGLPGRSPESSEGRSLLDLAALPHVWIKLSAPYRIADDPAATKPPADWLRALVRAAPERCIWGSDWPHTPERKDRRGANEKAPYRKIDYARALKDFCGALAEPNLAARILSVNPRRLFGFSAD